MSPPDGVKVEHPVNTSMSQILFNLDIVSKKYCYVKKCINVKSMALSINQRATLDMLNELN